MSINGQELAIETNTQRYSTKSFDFTTSSELYLGALKGKQI